MLFRHDGVTSQNAERGSSLPQIKARVDKISAGVNPTGNEKAELTLLDPAAHEAIGRVQADFLENLPGTSLDSPSYNDWCETAEDLFRVRLQTEWPTWSDALKGWQFYTESVCHSGRFSPVEQHDLALRLAVLLLNRWLDVQPVSAAAFLDADVERKSSAASPGVKHIWEWYRSAWEDSLYSSADHLPPGRSEAFRQRAEKALRQYWDDSSIPADERTSSVVMHATLLYSNGQGSAAAALLDDWMARGGTGVAENSDWIFQRFFVAAYGEGNATLAISLFRRIEARVTAGSLPANDPSFVLMTQCYYRLLPNSLLSWHKIADETMKKRVTGKSSQSRH